MFTKRLNIANVLLSLPAILRWLVIMSLGSGRGDSGVLFPELSAWHWGAFIFTWIWGIFNKTYISVMLFLIFAVVLSVFQLLLQRYSFLHTPIWYCIGGLILFGYFAAIHVYHGIYGRRWAWQNKVWRDLPTFRRTQKYWSLGGFCLIAISLIFFASSIYYNRSDNVLAVAAAKVELNPAIQGMVGLPITLDKSSLKILYSNNSRGKFVQYRFLMRGSKDNADVYFLALKQHDEWQILSEAAYVKSQNKLFVLRSARQ